MSSNPAAVRLVEVGPRDGLQNVSAFVPTSTKIELIHRLRRAGLQTIELTSAVSPKAIPQLADCASVLSDPGIKALQRETSLRLPVLVPNSKGLELAVKHGVKEIAVFISATEGFSKANINATVEEGLRRARDVASRAIQAKIAVRGYISCIFEDPYLGPTSPYSVLHCARQLLDMGCYEISLGDTTGVGTASQVRHLVEYLTEGGIPIRMMAGHFHDTYGQAVANVWEAYRCGITVFDCSVGGLGGCPFAPGAKGNVATEDLVYMFQQSGVRTNIDLSKLAETGHWISQQLLKSNDSRAGAALLVKRQSRQRKVGTEKAKQAPLLLPWTALGTGGEVDVFRAGANIRLVLNRPKNGNALTSSMIAQLTKFFERAKTDTSISRIIITANGKFFCTGMDLGKNSSPVACSETDSMAQFERLTQLFEAIDNAPQVTIAGMNGPAFGGGVGLAFACDVRFAVKTAGVSLSEVRLGLCPATISKYIVREWGFAFAREAMLSSRRISASELKERGLLTHVVEHVAHLSQYLDEYVCGLSAAAPNASRMCKELVRLGYADAGGQMQADGIKNLFMQMMSADGEAAWGLSQFQAGNKTVNWDTRSVADAMRAKL